MPHRPMPLDYPTTWKQFRMLRQELNELYQELKSKSKTTNTREDVLCFPYPNGDGLLFNQTRILGVDPTDAESVRIGTEEGKLQIKEFYEGISKHPAFASAYIAFISPMLGIREGRRIVGDYVLSGEDCLNEARFEDMVAACGYALDIHNPKGAGTTLIPIPGTGYYHTPWRSLISRDFKNLLMGSQCICGTHEAHSSYGVMPSVSAIGQASGTGAAIARMTSAKDIREVRAAEIRYALREANQFTEGACEPSHRMLGH